MTISLYDISVGSYLQVVGAVAGILDIGAKYCADQGIDTAEIVDTRLREDMLPFRFQVISVAHHSLGTVKAMESGTFGPPSGYPDYDYAGLQGLIKDTQTELAGFKPEDIDAMAENPVAFVMGSTRLPFSAANFVLSFSHPNVYFHAATTYDILRMEGAPLGKMNFMGPLRMNK